MSSLIRNTSSISLCILVNGIITLRFVRCVWELIAVAKYLPDFLQVKGCQGARDAAHHCALLGVFGEKTEATETT